MTAETTLAAAARLARSRPDEPACLNFASAKNPGGGYRGGAEAQEESLARSSALVAVLEATRGFHDHHRRERDLLYTDRVIHSPHVPVFRDDRSALLDEPYTVTFLTAAAPNAGALRDRDPDRSSEVEPTLRRRATRVLAVAAHHGHRRVVLGAWGCGVFRNDPAQVAAAFATPLSDEFATAFDDVVFAIHDRLPGQPVLQAFRDRFAHLT